MRTVKQYIGRDKNDFSPNKRRWLEFIFLLIAIGIIAILSAHLYITITESPCLNCLSQAKLDKIYFGVTAPSSHHGDPTVFRICIWVFGQGFILLFQFVIVFAIISYWLTGNGRREIIREKTGDWKEIRIQDLDEEASMDSTWKYIWLIDGKPSTKPSAYGYCAECTYLPGIRGSICYYQQMFVLCGLVYFILGFALSTPNYKDQIIFSIEFVLLIISTILANYFSTNKAHGHLSIRWFPRLIKIKNLELLNDFDGIILGTITTIPVSAFGDGNKIENLPDDSFNNMAGPKMTQINTDV